MAIVSTNIRNLVTQRNSAVDVVIDLTDHLGNIYTHFQRLPSGSVIDAAYLAGLTSRTDIDLIDSEVDAKTGEVLDGAIDAIAVLSTLEFASVDQFIRYILRKVFSEDNNVEDLITIDPLMTYVQTNYTVPQITTLLGITTLQWTSQVTRVGQAVAISVQLDNINNAKLDLG